jgi:hypothetical protein
LVVAIADWWALRRGAVSHPPALLVVLVALIVACLGTRLIALVGSLITDYHRPVRRLAELATIAGVALALVAGGANWLLRLQGTVILNEREAVPLHGGTALQVFESGLLSDIQEMGLTLMLEELQLEPFGEDGFYPLSRLRVWKEEENVEALEITPRQRAEFDSLRFHQGAFGFAPRVVILRDGETLFDRVVPFTSRRLDHDGISFDGHFTVEEETLAVTGTVDLTSLDEAMRGHATLLLSVLLDDQSLGQGSLQPGYFADLDRGYRVGFAGLERWSEVVVSRRNYGHLVKAGGIAALIGLAIWPLAAWRKW